MRANQVMDEFHNSEAGQNFSGEVFAIGDCIGGVLMFEALSRGPKSHLPISRHSSSVSSHSKFTIPEGAEADVSAAVRLRPFPCSGAQHAPERGLALAEQRAP